MSHKQLNKMKTKFLMGAIALLSVFAFTMTSCNKDEEDEGIEITNVEMGHEGTAIIGQGIHLKCAIKAPAKIESIVVTMKAVNGEGYQMETYDKGTDKGKYVGKYIGLLNTVFNENIVTKETLPEDNYNVAIIVTDEANHVQIVTNKVAFKKGKSKSF